MYYPGNLLDEGDILEWMMKQKLDQSIEDIDRDTLFNYIETKEFLAVVWCKYYIYYYLLFYIPSDFVISFVMEIRTEYTRNKSTCLFIGWCHIFSQQPIRLSSKIIVSL